jgi:thioredoxin-dependent peroxiredoxin
MTRTTIEYPGPKGPGLRTLLILLAAGWLAVAAGATASAPAGADLQVGDAAPAFSLVGSDGKTYTLGEFTGKKAVVVAWFPKAFTGG